MRIRNRIPGQYFETTGIGESDVTVHAGSFHLALHDAGIEMANIMSYSSILPKEAELIPYPGRHNIHHGEVMESIVAHASCGPGERATAGIIYGWLYDEHDQKYGGLVCEYNGAMHKDDVYPHLEDMLGELYHNGYSHMELREKRSLVSTVIPDKSYGSALAALCFVNHIIPEVTFD